VHLEASTKAHVHKKIHEFFINMAFTMVCPNFKKGMKMAFGPLGVKYATSLLKYQMSIQPPSVLLNDVLH
jgi:hypothetical protein